METLQAIRSRYSCRRFADTPVERREIEEIVAAGSLAAIGRGSFANVSITVVSDPALISELEEAGRKFRGNPEFKAFYGAPVLIAVSVKADDNLSPENCACVMENMLLAAADKGLAGIYLHSPCAYLGADTPEYKKLGAPEGFIPGAFMALGFSAAEAPAARELTPRVSVNWL